MKIIFPLLALISVLFISGCVCCGDLLNQPPELDLWVRAEHGVPEYGFTGMMYTISGDCSDPDGRITYCALYLGDESGVMIYDEDGVVEESREYMFIDAIGVGFFEINYTYWEEGDYQIMLSALDDNSADAILTYDFNVGSSIPPHTYLASSEGFDRVVGEEIVFETQCLDENWDTLYCELDFGDGTTQNLSLDSDGYAEGKVYHEYNATGLFTARLLAIDSAGNIGESYMLVDTRIDEKIQTVFKWEYMGLNWTWAPIFNSSLVEYYINKPRPPSYDFSIYVTDTRDDEVMNGLLEVFLDTKQRYNLSEKETINLVISFVQQLEYTSDDVTTGFDEYPRYPLETIAALGGDCEDTAILAVELLDKMGYNVVLLGLPGHMAVGVECNPEDGFYYTDDYGVNYCFLESTGNGYKIGQLSDEKYRTTPDFNYLVPRGVPSWIIDYDYDLDTSKEEKTYTVNATVQNQGTGDVKDVLFRMMVYYPQYSKYGIIKEKTIKSIPVNSNYTFTQELKVPSKPATKLIVQLFIEDVYLDKYESPTHPGVYKIYKPT